MSSGKMPASPRPTPSSAAEPARTISHALVDALFQLGVREAFGIVGGAIAPFCDVLGKLSRAGTAPRVFAMRHEAGAAFAAAEASLAADRPTLVFTTTGPGLTNALTAIHAARGEGAHVVVICGATSAAQRGRGAVQETSDVATFGVNDVRSSFDLAVTLEAPHELAAIVQRLAHGFASPKGFAALIALPLWQQRASIPPNVDLGAGLRVPPVRRSPIRATASAMTEVLSLLHEDSFAIWVGRGAHLAAPQVRAFAERTGAKVFSTPRGKGVFPEDHGLYIGVTGFGGHAQVEDFLEREKPARILVLGSRLGEYSSVWDERLVPREGFIHVDVDASAFGAAFPNAKTLPVVADIGAFLDDLLASLPSARPLSVRPRSGITLVPRDGPVRPQALMAAIQHVVVEPTTALVMAEPGNSFAWTNHHLRFPSPRYRMSGAWASMGHMVTGALGAALATNRHVVVVTGDGSMLMANEISSAATYGAKVVWVVLNDARYGITEAGMSAQGFTPVETRFPRVDFVGLARALGADGLAVSSENDLAGALELALAKEGPFVVDVEIDVSERAPFLRRIQALTAMGANR